MKPYRLISPHELDIFKSQFQETLNQWNDHYALEPLSFSLSIAPKEFQSPDVLAVTTEQETLALAERVYLPSIQSSLFGQEATCFDACSQELFFLLVRQLLQNDACCLEELDGTPSNWFYAGSTSLILSIVSKTTTCRLILSPEWVQERLLQSNRKLSALQSIHEALDSEVLQLNVELMPCAISLQEFMQLQAGDILETDHPLEMPLIISQDKQTVAEAELGQSTNYKSIQLKRSL